jgi:hypothetical protein
MFILGVTVRKRSSADLVGLVLVVFALLSGVPRSATPGFEHFLSTWKGPATSGAPDVTMHWEDRGGGIVYISVHQGAAETVPTEVIAFRQDGKDYPYGVRGGDVTSTIASTSIDPRTLDITYKIAGTRVTRGRWIVSQDGKTLTVGRPDGSTWTLTRQGRASSSPEPPPLKTGYKRYIGVWEAVQTGRGASTGSVVWEDRGDDFVVATVRDKAGQVTMRYSLKYDGKAYPCNNGPSGSVGTITSVFVDEYKTDWKLFRGGVPGGVGSRIVAADGQRMVVPARKAGDTDLIWRRVKDAPTDGILTP